MANEIVFYASPDVFSPTPAQIITAINTQLGSTGWQSAGASGTVSAWGDLTGNITDQTDAIAFFAQASHAHSIADISGLQSALDGKLGNFASLLSTQSGNQLTGALKEWAGTLAGYNALATKENTTRYSILSTG